MDRFLDVIASLCWGLLVYLFDGPLWASVIAFEVSLAALAIQTHFEEVSSQTSSIPMSTSTPQTNLQD